MKFIVATILVLVLSGCQDSESTTDNSAGSVADAISAIFEHKSGAWQDLTHAFSQESVYWPTDVQGFELEELDFGYTDGGWFYSSYRYSGAEHGGTHLDAPIHFAENRQSNDEIPLSRLIAPAVVVDVSDRSHPDYQVTLSDLTDWEQSHGQIPDGAILLVRTGWGERYNDRTAYLGTAQIGPEAVADLHFPGLGPEAAQWLVDNRNIAAFGLDTASVDFGQSVDFRAHVILYSENIPGFENIANLEVLPAVGSFVVALPMKIQGGSGGPLRIVAYIPN